MKYLIDLYGTCLLKNRNFETIHNINKRTFSNTCKCHVLKFEKNIVLNDV